MTFAEAMTVFADPLALTGYDPDYSGHEYHYLTMSHSADDRLLVVSHTDCGGNVRIISGRAERRDHEDGDSP